MGFCVLIVPGTILQLLIAFVFSLLCMLLTAVASPFVSDVDDTIGKAFGFALSSIFFFAVIIKVQVLTESLDDYLSPQLRKKFELNSVVIGTLMTATCAIALLVTFFVALQQILLASKTLVIKLRSHGRCPALSVAHGITWHLFLSQCAHAIRITCLALPRHDCIRIWFVRGAASGARGKTNAPPSSASSLCSCRASLSSLMWTTWSRLMPSKSTLMARRSNDFSPPPPPHPP